MREAKDAEKQWVSVKYHTTVIMEKSALLADGLLQQLDLGDQKE